MRGLLQPSRLCRWVKGAMAAGSVLRPRPSLRRPLSPPRLKAPAAANLSPHPHLHRWASRPKLPEPRPAPGRNQPARLLLCALRKRNEKNGSRWACRGRLGGPPGQRRVCVDTAPTSHSQGLERDGCLRDYSFPLEETSPRPDQTDKGLNRPKVSGAPSTAGGALSGLWGERWSSFHFIPWFQKRNGRSTCPIWPAESTHQICEGLLTLHRRLCS